MEKFSTRFGILICAFFLGIPHFSFAFKQTLSSSNHALMADCATALSGTVYVGAGAGTPQYAGFKQLFDAINAQGLGGDLMVKVQSNVVESNAAVLNAIQYFCGSDQWQIRIEPASDTPMTITSSSGALMQFNGVKNVIVDGSFDGSGQYLIFRSAVNNQSALVLSDGVTNCSFNHCVFEASGSTAQVIRIGTGSGNAVTHVTIDGCDIRNRSDLAQNADSKYQIGIASRGGSANQSNASITISNNTISRFIQSGIDIGPSILASANIGWSPESLSGNNTTLFNGEHNGSFFSITGNRLFEPIANTVNTMSIPIKFNPGIASHSNVISENYIGGSDASNAGTWINPSLKLMVAIYIQVGGETEGEATYVSNNTISRIEMNGTGNGMSAFVGIQITELSRVRVIGNTIGSLDETNAILSLGGGYTNHNYISHMYPIWNYSLAPVEISSNIVANISAIPSNGVTKMCGIRNGVRENFPNAPNFTDNVLFNRACGQVIVKDNIVSGLTSSSKCWRTLTSPVPTDAAAAHPGAVCGIMVMTNSTDNDISFNQISNLHNTVPSNGQNRSTVVIGLALDGSGPTGVNATGIVNGNRISDLKNDHQVNNHATDRPEILGISLGVLIGVSNMGTTQGRGNFTLTNNMISLDPQIPNNSTLVAGIMDQIQAPSTVNILNNTVYIAGTGMNSLTPSAAYVQFPNRGRAATDGLSTVTNNIFINERTGMTNAFAVASSMNDATTAAYVGSHNFMASSSTSDLSSWQSTTGGLGAWQVASGTDADSYTALTVSGTESTSTLINVSELFVDVPADLHLQFDNTNQWPLEHVVAKGVALAQVTMDVDNTPRNLDTPTLGADEEFVEECIAPEVTAMDGTSNVCQGDAVVLSTTVTGTSLIYQWQVLTSGETTWVNVNDMPNISGAQSPQLNIASASLSLSSNQYRLYVSNGCGNDYSDTITLVINPGTLYYADLDGDGHGDPDNTIITCEQPDGFVTTGNDCDDSDHLVWLAKLVEIVFDLPSSSVCLDVAPFELTGASPTGGVWSGSGVSQGIFTPAVAGLGTHVLSYFVEGDGACALPTTATVSLTVMNCTSVNEWSAMGVSIYPTLFNQGFTVNASNPISLTILDALGNRIDQLPMNTTQQWFDMSGYAAGIYFIRIDTQSQASMIKVMKVH